MDPTYTFPPPQAPTPRPHPPSTPSISSPGAAERQSDALRASVLDAALELGIGSNSTVTNWMFSNSLSEDDEEDQRSPALTYGSTATSDESSFSTRNPLSPHITQIPNSPPFVPPEGRVHFRKSINNPPSRSLPYQTVAPFADLQPHPPIPPRPVTPVRCKLKKKRTDGYESDGGYVSDPGKKKKPWRKKADKEEAAESSALPPLESKAEKKERVKEAKTRAKEEKLQEKKEKEEERIRKRSLSRVKKGSQVEDNDVGAHIAGYETDVTRPKSKKTKAKISDGGYETDSGYISSTTTPTKSKSKSRFFKIGSKQSKSELRQEDGVPAMPTFAAADKEPPVPLPIASRFATTLTTSPVGTTPPSPFPSTTPPAISLSLTNEDLKAPSVFTTASSSSSVITSSSSNTITPVHSPTSQSHTTLPFLNRRASYGSMESGTSSATAKRRGFGFFAGQAQDKGITESPASQVSVLPIVKKSVTTSSLSSGSPSSTASKFQAISLPITHASGSIPSSPVPSSIGDQLPFSISPLSPSTSQTSLSPGSVTSPISRNQSAPVSRNQFHQSTAPTKLPPFLGPSHSITRVRPLNPPTDGFGPRVITRSPSLNPSSVSPTPALSPSNAGGSSTPASLRRSPSPNPRIPPPQPPQRTPTRHPTHLTITSPSFGALPPSPNVLAYYDIPPPSPPPTGPLPSVPPPGRYMGGANSGGKNAMGSSWSRDRSSADGSGSQSSHSSHGGHGHGFLNAMQVQVQRGRESPFPSRPILPAGGPSASSGILTGGPSGGAVLVPPSTSSSSSSLSGFQARAKVPRYRELYGLALPPPVLSASASPSPSPLLRGRLQQQQSLPSLTSHEQQQRSQEMPSRFGRESLHQQRASDMIRKVGDRNRDRESDMIDVAVIEPSEVGYDDQLGDDGEQEDVRYVLNRFKEAWLKGGNDDDELDGDDDHNEPELNYSRLRSRLQPHHVAQETPRKRKSRSLEEDGSYYGSIGSGSGSDHHHHSVSHGTRDSSLEDAEEYGDEEEGSEEHLAIGSRKSLSTEESSGDRTSRWSGSIYSRTSILDPDKSEEARQRFVKRVEDMYGDGGREKISGNGSRQQEKVPPVPKIPDEYVFATTGRNWNRF